ATALHDTPLTAWHKAEFHRYGALWQRWFVLCRGLRDPPCATLSVLLYSLLLRRPACVSSSTNTGAICSCRCCAKTSRRRFHKPLSYRTSRCSSSNATIRVSGNCQEV